MGKQPPARRQPRIAVIDGNPTTTSRDIAETFGKAHADVLRRIRTLDCSEDFNARNFAAVEFIDGKGEQRTEYRITRDGFAFLCMGFTGARAATWKERYIDRFNRMTERIANPVPAPGPQQLQLLPHTGPSIRTQILATAPPLARPLDAAAQQAVNARAWELLPEAHTLLQEFLARRVAYHSATNPDGTLQADAVRRCLAETNLDQILMARIAGQAEVLRTMATVTERLAGDFKKAVAEALAPLAPAPTAKPPAGGGA